MSQNNYTIGNQTTPSFRADLNSALQALASNSSGTTAPATTYANMFWYDTAANILKMRSEADDVWINVAYVDQSANAWRVLDNTQVVDTSGTPTGYLGVHATSVWQSGVSTNDSLVSPAKVNAAIQALVPNVLNASGTAPLYACRAWVNFNGTGTVAIRASGNVSSITDNGTGDYTVNFATAMPDANYCAVVTVGGAGTLATGNALVGWAAGYASGSVRIGVSDNNTDLNSDAPYANVAIFR